MRLLETNDYEVTKTSQRNAQLEKNLQEVSQQAEVLEGLNNEAKKRVKKLENEISDLEEALEEKTAAVEMLKVEKKKLKKCLLRKDIILIHGLSYIHLK